VKTTTRYALVACRGGSHRLGLPGLSSQAVQEACSLSEREGSEVIYVIFSCHHMTLYCAHSGHFFPYMPEAQSLMDTISHLTISSTSTCCTLSSTVACSSHVAPKPKWLKLALSESKMFEEIKMFNLENLY